MPNPHPLEEYRKALSSKCTVGEAKALAVEASSEAVKFARAAAWMALLAVGLAGISLALVVSLSLHRR